MRGKISHMSDLVQSIRERYLQTLDNIASAAHSAGREPESVKLVVVTKSQSVEVTRAAMEAGAQICGRELSRRGCYETSISA